MPNEVILQTEPTEVNKIQVTVSDTKTPVVILFGPSKAGKTMVMLRMIRYFKQHNYSVVPDKIFRPATDRKYQEICAELDEMAYSRYAPDPTGLVSFMLAKILDSNGNPLFQFLEAPGEHYYSGYTAHQFPVYLQQIFGLNMKKIWVFLLEHEWGEDQNERDKYADQIKNAKQFMSPKDSAIFLLNKADMYPNWFGSNNKPNKRLFRNAIDQAYPNLIQSFDKGGFFSSEPPVVCFSAGSFVPVNDGNNDKLWILRQVDDSYCEDFFKELKKI